LHELPTDDDARSVACNGRIHAELLDCPAGPVDLRKWDFGANNSPDERSDRQ